MVAPFDATEFRRTLGYLPTGVTVITSTGEFGEPVGMACNSFMSVSLNPPLVMFCAGKASATLVDFRRSGRFCVNILGGDQGELCRQFSIKDIDRFAGVPWTDSPVGPELGGAVAWMSCVIEVEHDAGDHVIIIARVTALRVNPDEPAPLVFHRGKFGSFYESVEPLSAVAALPRQTVGGSRRVPPAAPGAYGYAQGYAYGYAHG
ncbi:Flavin-dependent monooxygenase, reductase subunit HsaB [Streptomyces sp. YIM 121038]|uniref:flavin reductase family protein n=1 Tax=Streptomyces sp. YIM 121038 TaxID=2136401 RepID=UPI0011108F16|nr:flavin reductase family protein [Streptomyces sp. YIM 121038]QCX76433.1 Flavin-dependent monooxygenase, reductase subunit HsaB [Streptomyces sp. YIM 121038]